MFKAIQHEQFKKCNNFGYHSTKFWLKGNDKTILIESFIFQAGPAPWQIRFRLKLIIFIVKNNSNESLISLVIVFVWLERNWRQ